MLLECLLAAIAFALGARALGLRAPHAGLLLLSMLASGGAAAVATTSMRRPPPASVVATSRPGFATSNACRSCHPAQYSSWHASYHRRMTQPPSLENVAAPVLRQGGRLRLEATGRSVELFAKGGELWASVPDPELTSAAPSAAYESVFRSAPNRDVRVRLLTGSHHHQAFWVAGARSGELRALPVVYSIDEHALLPRRDAFLNPPDAPEVAVRWNSNCVQCHSVAGAPRHDEGSDSFQTSAAELGVACEACHGAGEAHVARMRDPRARYRAHGGDRQGLEIVNPLELDSARGSEVCGRCHSYFFPKDEADWWENGFAKSYRPGDDLSRAQLLLSPEALSAEDAPELAASTASMFYADGTIRVGGREYNGLVRSPCFERGQGKHKLSCFSCHSLHDSDPNDQLAAEKSGNDACLACHENKRENPTAHTHHASASTGSLCYNCHMPHTTYALLGAIRSHRVDSPAFDERTRDRPNACNLCHLAQSEAWAAEHARAWFGDKPQLTLTSRKVEHATLPAGAVFALTGDAAVRAITAAALGRRESADDDDALRRQLLESLSADEYAAVRSIARKSQKHSPTTSPKPLADDVVRRLLAERDHRPVTIAE